MTTRPGLKLGALLLGQLDGDGNRNRHRYCLP
jgi:hypothetical protein